MVAQPEVSQQTSLSHHTAAAFTCCGSSVGISKHTKIPTVTNVQKSTEEKYLNNFRVAFKVPKAGTSQLVTFIPT